MSQDPLYPDWKKKASALLSRNTNKDQQEAAFLNLAYGAVSQKAGKLMEDPHRLGFEIVYSNEDSSKMAGLFAFRVGRSLISVPAIYIANEVKGTELMYEHDVKLFRPLSVDWADHVVSKYQQKEAMPEERHITNRMTSGMYLDRIAQPGGFAKRASADLWEGVIAEWEAHSKPDGNILNEFLVDAGRDVMCKLAAAIDQSIDFANALTSLDESIWLPEFPMEKSAGDATPDLEFYFGDFPFTKMAADQNDKAHQRGWFLWENRSEDDLNPVVRDTSEIISEVNTPGLYKVVTSTGDIKDAWVLNKYDTYNSPSGCCAGTPFSGSKDKVIIWKDDKSMCYHSGNSSIWGDPVLTKDGTSWKWEDDAELAEKPSVGKTYYAVDVHGGDAYGPHKVISVKERSDGITVIEALEEYSDKECPETHYINPDVAHITHQEGNGEIFPSSVRWLEVRTEKKDYGSGFSIARSKTRPGTHENVFHALGKVGVKRLRLLKEKEGPNVSVVFDNEVKFDNTDVPNAAVKIASEFRISANDAMELVDDMVKQAGNEIEAYVITPTDMTKSAMQMMGTSMSIIGTPQFMRGHDADLGVQTEGPQSWNLESATTQPGAPPRHYGDAYDPTLGTSPGNQDRYLSEEAAALGMTDDILFDSSPEEIASLYTQSNIPNLFQHGTVGMLVGTYDSAGLIMKYIPKLEEGLDHFGRILFLFYWKPQDFEKLYGADDLANLEQEILNQFKSYGDILLQLIKKNEVKYGSVPTP